jgi:hypothetical protein
MNGGEEHSLRGCTDGRVSLVDVAAAARSSQGIPPPETDRAGSTGTPEEYSLDAVYAHHRP